MFIKKGDIVQVMCGDDKGKRGKVLEVRTAVNKLVIEGINRAYKHLKKSQKNPQGGRLSKEMPVAISNVQLIHPQTNRPTRVGIRYREDGSKELVTVGKSGPQTTLRVLSKARKAYAKV